MRAHGRVWRSGIASAVLVAAVSGGASASAPRNPALITTRVTARVDTASRLPSLVMLGGVSMATARLGWAMVGNGRTRKVARTVDGGRTWRLRLRAAGPVEALAAPDAAHLLLLENACATHACRVDLVERVSTARGSSWRTLWRSAPGGAAALSFPSARVGYVLSWPAFGNGPLTLFSTVDGGRAWHQRVLSLPRTYAFAFAAALSFASRRDGWMLLGSQPGAGEQEKALFTTDDGGAHWRLSAHTGVMGMPGHTADTLPISGYVESLTLRTDGTGYMGLVRGGLFVSRDGGRTFRSAYLAEVQAGSDFGAVVGFLPSGFAWLYTGFADPLYASADAGRTWRPVYPPEWPTDLASLPGGEAAGAVTPSDPEAIVETGRLVVPWTPPLNAPGPISAFEATAPDELVVAYDGSRRLAMSQDSGASWSRLPVPSGYAVEALALSGPAVGWLLCDQPTAQGPDMALFARSLAAGPLRWRRVHTPFVPTAATALVGKGGTAGFALGSAGAGPSALWWTPDGGARWQVLQLPDSAALTGVGSSSRVAWAFGPHRIYLTDHTGVTWTEIDLPPALSPTQVSFGDGSHGLIVTATGAVWSTADAGSVWHERFPGWPWFSS